MIAGLGLIGAALAGLIGAGGHAEGSGSRGEMAARGFDAPTCRPTRRTPRSWPSAHADGWYETRKQTVVFIDRDGAGYRALSATCTHLGCRVSWDDQTQAVPLSVPRRRLRSRRARRVRAAAARRSIRVNVRVNPQTSDLEVEL